MNWSDKSEPLWKEVPENVRREPAPVAATVEPRGRRRWLPFAVAALVLALAGWAGWATYAMRENEQRAVSWQERTKSLQADAKRLSAVLASRTRTLNDRVDQLNTLGVKLGQAQAALTSSQGDVSSLEVRQRQLASEKASLEDQARILDGVAGAYLTCKDDLLEVLSQLERGRASTAAYNQAQTSCVKADIQLQAYVNAF